MENITIIGGGVAGLSCLNFFLDQQHNPLLLEGGEIGSPKMCGEFVAPSILSFLNEWQIGSLKPVEQIHFISSKSFLNIALPVPAAALSRQTAEIALAKRARELGGKIREHAPINKIIPPKGNQPYQLWLNSGEVIETHQIICATGRFLGENKAASQYIGFKTHINFVMQPNTLHMFAFKGGYFGLVPLDDFTSNLTCIVKKKALDAYKDILGILQHCIRLNMPMSQQLAQIDWARVQWLEGSAPAFGFKKTPPWNRAYWIGDALINLPPAIGYGFAHSMLSAQKVVQHLVENNSHRAIKMNKELRSKLWISQGLHFLLQKPNWCNVLASRAHAWPEITEKILKNLDYSR